MITQYVFFFDGFLFESIVIMYLGDLSPSCLCQKVNMIYGHWKLFFQVEGGVCFLGSFVFQHIIFFYLFLWWTATGRHYIHPRRPYSLAQIHRANFVVHFFTGIIVDRELNVDYKNFADLSIRIKVFLQPYLKYPFLRGVPV